MNITEFLQNLSSQNVELWVDGDKLRYKAPQEVLTPTLLSEIKQRKPEIINFLKSSVAISNTFPLSYGQQALYFLYKLEPLSVAYNVAFSFRICSHVDVKALQLAVESLIARHPMLRTNFREQDGELVQEIHSNYETCFEVVDASNLNVDELKQQVIKEHQRPFNLETGPIARVTLFHITDQDYILLLSIHHIACDGWSIWILLDELLLLYAGQKDGVAVSLIPINSTYKDFVNWQAQLLNSSEKESMQVYWQQELAGELPVLNLATDRPRPPVQTYNGATYSFKLSPELTQKLKELAKLEGVTLYIVILAVFQVLLHRYTGQEDILVGSPTAGRSKAEFAQIVGYFANPVVQRANFSGNPTFQEFLSQVRSTVLGAITHQDYPFPLLVKQLQPERDQSRSPLFQASFVLQKAQLGSVIELLTQRETGTQVQRGDLLLEPFEIAQQEGQFDLDLDIIEANKSLFGAFKYNTDLFNRETIEQLTGHFQNLLSAIVSNPQQKVSELSILSQAELHQLLVEWNHTATAYPQDKCIHELFEQQVEKTPSSVAVVFGDEQLTYKQLNTRANQLAHHLQTLGVKPEVLVGICVERSIEMVVGLLGILKAGGAYVPLDPSYPQERLNYILSDSQVSVLLTQQKYLESFPEIGAKVVCLDTDSQIISTHSDKNLSAIVQVNNLAYVIYTSGSTGTPKGVMVEHQSLVNFISSAKIEYGIGFEDRILQFSSISFDVSVEEIYPCLTCGGILILRTSQILNSVSLFVEKCREWKLTVLDLPTAYWQQLISELVATNEILPSSVRLVIIGGEGVLPGKIRLWQKYVKNLEKSPQLINAYGPTETTVEATIFNLSGFVLGDTESPIPIGRPIGNIQTYILDKYLQPVPIGVPGEIYIGGDGLARGYLNQPELTADKFIPNPFDNSKSKRLYRTGDLARYLSDGNIEYLGRIDNQVKVRGYRIELGEIESVLQTHPQVQQVVVIAREDVPGNKKLVAYVVAQENSLTSNQLRELTQKKLPEYMLPSSFVILDTLPLTPNGKVDRKALPAPGGEWEREGEYIAPRTASEEIIANIFTNVFGVEKVSVYDNFFKLGGHSLLATQLISRIRQAFEVELPLRAVFESPTVAQLGQTLEQLRISHQGLSLPAITSTFDSVEQLPLSWAQERLWFLNQLEGASATYNMPLSVHISGELDINALREALLQIIQRHSILRTSFQTVNDTPVQVIHPEVTIDINLVDLQQMELTERETSVAQQAYSEAITPFNLEKAPLVRCTLLQLAASETVLLLTMHHIVCDGWSMGVFIQEVSALYQTFCLGEDSPLGELPIQYADFAVWQRQWLSGEWLQTQLDYWKQQLEGAPQLLQLPTDRTRPSVQTFSGSTYTFTLNPQLTQQLCRLTTQSGTTLFMTLLAAFATLLYRYSGQSDILIGSPIANRNRSEIEPLIGFFVNTLVLRTHFEDNPSFQELLTQVRETTLKAYEYQDVPFEQVVEALQPQRELSYSPLFQVMFVLQNAPMGELELPGVTLTLQQVESTITKFDLTLSMQETADSLVGLWEYNTDLFNKETIERMTGHLQNLLSAIVS
ncbi:non-ribosomal peptide synthetase, partial [Dulcicalothrix desertica]|uniref:non-ribosomal peptide synthetase n=2 Tax=Dulcicalothrix desertica TaxID=32056 RepID=UPI00119BD02B